MLCGLFVFIHTLRQYIKLPQEGEYYPLPELTYAYNYFFLIFFGNFAYWKSLYKINKNK